MTGFDPATTGKALGTRLADIGAAMERLDSFAFVPDAAPDSPSGAPGTTDAARELVLRAFSVMGDGINFRLLRRLERSDASLADLAAAVDLPVAAAWERVNDLVQVGMAARSLEGGRVGLTAAGRALVGMVEEMAAAAAGGP